MPFSGTDCGLPEALSEIEMDPLSAPPDNGAKLTVMEQLADAASEAPQSGQNRDQPIAEKLAHRVGA